MLESIMFPSTLHRHNLSVLRVIWTRNLYPLELTHCTAFLPGAADSTLSVTACILSIGFLFSISLFFPICMALEC